MGKAPGSDRPVEVVIEKIKRRKKCRLCNEDFLAGKEMKEYCSTECRRVHWSLRELIQLKQDNKHRE